MRVSLFTRKADATPREADLSWPDDFDAFIEVDATGKDVRLWSPALFGTPRRASSEVTTLCALVLDYDGDFDAESILEVWRGYEHVIHSTFTPGSYRVILPYAQPIPAEEHANAWAWAKQRDARIDGSCKDLARAYYWPTCRTDLDADPVFGYTAGERLDVARLPRLTSVAKPPSRSPSPSTPRSAGPCEVSGDTPSEGSAYAGIASVEQREDWSLIQSRCAFARHAVEDAASLREPEWYAALGLVSRCRGGDDIAHDISRPYAGYSQWETDTKLARAKQVGPPTCAHIRTISTACEGCPVQVTSPVMLGRRPVETPAPATEEQTPQERLAEVQAAHEQARLDEDAALVALEKAKRHLRTLRSTRAIASEEDIEAGVRAVGAAQDAARLAQRIRAYTEKALATARSRASLAGLPAGADPAIWSRLHIVKDRPAGTVGNVLAILHGDPSWGSRLGYDEFAQEVCLDREALPEERATEVTARLSYDYNLDATTGTVLECMRAAAKRRPFHPVREWLGTLKWDGVERVRDLLLVGFGVDPSGDEELVRLLGERFLLSILARAYKPGAKVDTMLVLCGKQGARKSTGLETLVGAQWFGSTKLDLANKDSFMQMRGKLLYEIGEMEGIKKADANVSKHWLSSRIDTYRAPYARRAEDHPRQTVVAGSTNEEEILLDPTGYRRYWPVRVVCVDLDWLQQHREQVWAEACVLRAAGRQWWFDENTDESERLRRMAAPYQQVHPWTEVIAAWLRERKDEPFTAVDVLRQAFGRMAGDLTQAEKTTVGSILRNVLQCPAERTYLTDGTRTMVYRKPASMPTLPGKVLPFSSGGR